MGRVLLCIGKQAEKPYFFDKTCQNIYAIEELCYVLGENANLLDEEIVDRDLAKWIDEECGLADLARNLYLLVNQKSSAAAFVGTILGYTGYFSKEKTVQIENVLKSGRHLSLYEKRKAKADYLVKRGKYTLAIVEYDSLIKELMDKDKQLLAKVIHNKATALTGLFNYDEAAENFFKAYELDGNVEDYTCYFAAKRLCMEEQDYIRFVAEHEDGYEISLTLEKKINQIMEQWQRAEKKEYMDVLLAYKEDGNKNLYYKEVEQMINGLKQEYRDCVIH